MGDRTGAFPGRGEFSPCSEGGAGPSAPAPLKTSLAETPAERYPPSVETTAYVAVVEAVEDAASRSASFAAVHLGRDSGCLIVAVEDDGMPRASGMTHLEDRVGALGGKLELGPTAMRAEIPCA